MSDLTIGKLTIAAAVHVASNMREWDRREIFATRWTDDPVTLGEESALYGEFAWVAGVEQPVAVVGAVPVHPGVWSVFLYATDEFRRISLPLTRFVKKCMIPALVETGAHRAECHSMEGHTEAHRWLEMLGARREGVRRQFGKNGEDFVCYAWRRGDVYRQQAAEG